MRTAHVGTQPARRRQPQSPSARRSQTVKRRRVPKSSLTYIVERAMQYEYQERAMFEMAAERATGPLSALFRRLAREEQYQLDYFGDWYATLPDAQDVNGHAIQDERQRMQLEVEVRMSQLPAQDDQALLDFVLEQEKEYRDFYLNQRLRARGKKLRSILMDLADEESIHVNLLLMAAGRSPEPRVEVEELDAA